MTREEDRADLQRHAEEIERHESFNYALLDADETELLGCVYVDPPEKDGADADVSFWVRADELDTGLEAELEAAVRAWIAADWPFAKVRWPGRDISWDDWDALPDHPRYGG